jgi:biopolymer transport protein ExbB
MRRLAAWDWRRIVAACCLGALLLCVLNALPAVVQAQDENKAATPATPAAAPATTGDKEGGESAGSAMVSFLFKSVTGYVLLFTYFAFIALIVWLLLDLRGAALMPIEFVETFEEALNKRKYKEAFEMAKSDGSMIGRVMTAGMARLQHGLQEAREAANAMIYSLKSRKDHILAYIAIMGTLGPLIGLVGTVSGMITSFAELGSGGTPNPSKLASGISHALNATLVGIFLSCLAIPAYSFYKNRLARITNDMALMVDDLLTQMYHSSRRPADATTTAATAKTSSATSPG